jgi:outer membrane protein
MQRWVVSLALTCVLAANVARAQLSESEPEIAPVLKQAQALLAEQRAADAFTLLQPLELEWGGTPNFDYVYGLAALDSGRAGDAAFALDRVVAVQPDFVGARMELARAEYELGRFDVSRNQFRYLLEQSPPPQTRAVIERYLEAIGKRSQFGGSRWSSTVQAAAGYDSNANGSTADDTFLGFTLDPNNVETDSAFGELGLIVGNTFGVGANGGFVSSLQLTHRANPDASFIDQTVAAIGTGYVHAFGATRLNAGISASAGWLDGEDHDRARNLDLGVTRRSANDFEFGVSLRAGVQEYEDAGLGILDVDRYLAGLSIARMNIGDHSGRFGLVLLGGVDEAKQDGSPYGADRQGGRVYTTWLLRPQSSLYAEVSAMTVDYKDGTFFGVNRKDDQFGVAVALEFQNWPAAKWSVAPRLRYQSSDSNVSLYEYDRVEAIVYVRRAF